MFSEKESTEKIEQEKELLVLYTKVIILSFFYKLYPSHHLDQLFCFQYLNFRENDFLNKIKKQWKNINLK